MLVQPREAWFQGTWTILHGTAALMHILAGLAFLHRPTWRERAYCLPHLIASVLHGVSSGYHAERLIGRGHEG